MKLKSSFLKKVMAVSLVLPMMFSGGIMQVFATENDAQTSQKEVHGTIAPINEEYLEYMKNGKTQNGQIPSSVDLSYLGERYAETAVNAYSNARLPESYDLRKEGAMGAVPEQGDYGTCWAFGVLGAAESSLIKKQFSSVDFSKKHLAWFCRKGNEEKEFYLKNSSWSEDYDPYMQGGNDLIALAALAAWKGPIYSSKLPYDDFDVEPAESLRYEADFHLQDCIYTYDSILSIAYPEPDEPPIELVKQLIMENGAYEIGYHAEPVGNEYYNDKTFAMYHNKKVYSDHSNLIIGWDDNFLRTNFQDGCQPENNGAWLVCNTWGPTWADDGCFWISYEDKTIVMEGSSYTFEDKDNYAKNYQYDTMGWTISTAADDFIDTNDASGIAYISNIFTAKDDEQLEAVSFYTTDVSTEYEISVYTDVEADKPVSGTLACDAQEGVEDYCGYHTIKLDSAVALEAGTKFSVVVKLTNPKYAYPIATEAVFLKDSDAEPEYLGNGGESYYSADGKNWNDIVELGKYAANNAKASTYWLYTTNVCLKAFTNPLPASGEAIGNVAFSLFEGEVAIGSELELSGAEEIHYTVTPIDGTEGEVTEQIYDEYDPIIIEEPCTVTAWGVKNGKKGNKVSKTFTQQVSDLSDLIIKSSLDGYSSQVDLYNLKNDDDYKLSFNYKDNKIRLRPCGKDKITINGKTVKSGELSGEITMIPGETNEITIKSEGEGKVSSSYTLKIYVSPLEYDYEKETVLFDESKYTVTDESGKELKRGASVSDYITIVLDETPKYLTVKNNETGEIKTFAVGQRPNLSDCEIDFYNERTAYIFSSDVYVSDKPDMSDAKNIGNDYYTVEPGKTVYIKRYPSQIRFASKVYPLEAPARPATPSPTIEKAGVDYITLSKIENGEYRIFRNGEWSEWQTENSFKKLEPETQYTVEARVAATDESFASLAGSVSASTLNVGAEAKIKVKYNAFGHTVYEEDLSFHEGETNIYPDDEHLTKIGYTISDEDKKNGKTVTVKNNNGVLTSDTSEIVFEVSADVTPSNYSYTVNYWDENGKIIKRSSFPFTHTEEIEVSEIKIPIGYEQNGLVNTKAWFAAKLIYDEDTGKWVVQSKEINLKVKVKENSSSDATFRIVHTNDIHGYYTATDKGVIGFAKLKTLSDFVDAGLILDAGDTYHGQAFATVEKGLSMAELMKEVGYDAMTPGNHDWSYGAERLKELEKAQGFPILAANVTDKDGNAYFDTPYLTKTVTTDKGTQLKVGVVGVIDSSFYDQTASENVKDVSFKAQAAAASETAKTLKDQENCDVVIALAHIADCEKFVSELSDVDVVIAGHQHLLIDTSYTDKNDKEVYVVEAGYYFNNVGVLSLTYDASTKSISKAEEKVYTSDDFAADSAVAAKIKEIEAREDATLSKVVGKSSSEYPYSWEELRVSEQPIGRVITAAYLDCTGADVAFENAGGIRGGIPKGNITYRDIIGISPYGNTIVTKELTGQQILDIIEYSLELSRECDEIYYLQKAAAAKGEDPYVYDFPSNSGSVLQFGGITVKYDMTKAEGNRIVSAEIGGKAVDLDKKYVVATNNYAAESTEYPGISDAPILKQYGTCEQALLNYIAKGSLYSNNKGGSSGNQSSGIPDDGAKPSSEFKDISNHWAESYITELVNAGIIKGMTETEFQPDGNLTRAQFLTLLYRLSGSDDVTTVASTGADFSDVAKTSWYYDCVNWGVANGIVSGMGDGTFAPDANVSREQMCIMLNNYHTYKSLKWDNSEVELSFSDKNLVSGWALDSVKKVVSEGIMSGRTDGSFDPLGKATRAEAAKIICLTRAEM